jgi:hypothetical protein
VTTTHNSLRHLAETLREEVEQLTDETAAEWLDEQLDVALTVEHSVSGQCRGLRSIHALCAYGGPTATVTWQGTGTTVDIEASWGHDTVTLIADAPALIEQFELIADTVLD